MKTLKRRKRERKTDYAKRIKLLKGGTPRIIFRKTNRYVIVQYVISREAQDKIVFTLTSKTLMKYKWPKEDKGSMKSITASYLIGVLAGKEISRRKLEKPIVDFGMHRMIHKTKVYAFLKGLIDSGIKIKCAKENFPAEERIEGKHMKKQIPFKEIKSSIEKQYG